MLTKMSGDDEFHKYDDPKLKGLGRYFNSTTIRGRANVAIGTYAVLIGWFLYAKFFNTKCPACEPPQSTKYKSRYENWMRGYINNYISEGTIRNIKNVSLTTLSFLGGFAFYHNIVREFIMEKDCDCYSSKPQPLQQKANVNKLTDQLNEKKHISKP